MPAARPVALVGKSVVPNFEEFDTLQCQRPPSANDAFSLWPKSANCHEVPSGLLLTAELAIMWRQR